MCFCSVTSLCIHFIHTSKTSTLTRNYSALEDRLQLSHNWHQIRPSAIRDRRAKTTIIVLCLLWLIACTINFFYVEMYEKIVKKNMFKIREYHAKSKSFSVSSKNHWQFTQIASQLFYYSFVLLYFYFIYLYHYLQLV